MQSQDENNNGDNHNHHHRLRQQPDSSIVNSLQSDNSSIASTSSSSASAPAAAAAAAAAAVAYLQNISRNKSPITAVTSPFVPAVAPSFGLAAKQKLKYENSQAICAINDAYLTTIEKTMLTAKDTNSMLIQKSVSRYPNILNVRKFEIYICKCIDFCFIFRIDLHEI